MGFFTDSKKIISWIRVIGFEDESKWEMYLDNIVFNSVQKY